jgi:hypothetical protein
MLNYSVGDKVVCIDDQFPLGIEKLYDQLPVKDKVYVVRDIRLGVALDCKNGAASVLLVGLVNPRAESKAALERGFNSDRFVKLEELQDAARERQADKKEQEQEIVEPEPVLTE